MKIIKLQESQFNRLIENTNSQVAPSFNGGDLKEFPGSEVSTTATVTNANGELEYGEQPTADEFANQQTPQTYLSMGRKVNRGNNVF